MNKYCFLLGVLCLVGRTASAATWDIATSGGVMQQPTSHYYLATYGLTLDAATATQKFIGRASYVERPEFRNAGFVDKDYGWFGMVGTKITKQPNRGLFAYFGAGRMAGYVKADIEGKAALASDSRLASNYAVIGPTAALEYAFRLGPVTLAAEHQTFIGYVDQTQLRAFVAWPYNFFQINAGVTW